MDAAGGRSVLDGLASLRVLVVMRDGQGCSSLTLLPMQRSSRQDRVLPGSNGDERQSSGQASKRSGRQRVKQEEQGYGAIGGGGEVKAKKRARRARG